VGTTFKCRFGYCRIRNNSFTTLASDYTPENLKSVELFKKGTVPGEVSTRFSQLENPTNVKATVMAAMELIYLGQLLLLPML
jgi:methionine synthase II (cobalamin-independent)